MSEWIELRGEIERVVSGLPVTFGVSIRYLETGEEVHLNSDRAFQLASVFKVPVLVASMQLIDAGRFSLKDRIELKEEHKTRHGSMIAHFRPGLQPTVEDLLLFMIIVSDNTATDMILELIGGPNAVNTAMRCLGFSEDDISITMRICDLDRDIVGSSECLARLWPSQIAARTRATRINYQGLVYSPASRANTGSPRAMNRLLEMIFRGEAASREACDTALDIMLRQTMNDRMSALLPPGTDVAHKTGSVMGVCNDSGILYINDGLHAATTVLTWRNPQQVGGTRCVVETPEQVAELERAIGRIGQLVFEYGRQPRR